ncbi:MarR family winged helix-turn-helix transcriptional regulator [uncultured Bosea sp.]|uniref:MarR family winged helix-turn-helix transcriptional regulator n=1 Tax=uncultured Bosea sp. TaxID=211457 RepID=UPI0025FD8261|nr:MarR family transcriptional regulator [uncultured Bosea sp.]
MDDRGNKRADIGIGWRLRRAHMAFSRGFRQELAKADMSFGQFVHLEKLWENDGPTQAELSRAVGIETASSTTILDELERRAFITRVRNPQDRRKINVYLTEAGRALEPVLLERARVVNLQAKTGLSHQQVEQLFLLLESVTEALNEVYPQASQGDARERLRS